MGGRQHLYGRSITSREGNFDGRFPQAASDRRTTVPHATISADKFHLEAMAGGVKGSRFGNTVLVNREARGQSVSCLAPDLRHRRPQSLSRTNG
jgi:hypothetical protein